MSFFYRYSVSLLENDRVIRGIEKVNLENYDTGDVLIRVAYSSLNYKDALSANGNRGISKNYPHTPGIDACGEIIRSNTPDFKPGDKVIITGHDLGMNTKGGFSQYLSVPSDWVLPLPENLSLKESMILGTAGLTAAMAIDKISSTGISIEPVIISGATGGVGSLSIMILNNLKIPTVAYSRKKDQVDYLKSLGAMDVIHHWEDSKKPLLKGIFSAGIDTVGGPILENMIKQVKPYGSIALCGLAASSDFSTTVFPFILRGLTLHGIESAEAPNEWRKRLWRNLAEPWKPDNLERISKEVNLQNLSTEIEKMLAGQAHGRVVVNLMD